MKSKSALFSLIQALDPAERRYFKRYSRRQSSVKRRQYLFLFECIESQKVYNETELKQAIGQSGETALTKNLSFHKKYLYKLILKILRQYHTGRTPAIRFYEALTDASILLEKGLLKQARVFLRRAFEIAAEYHLPAGDLMASTLERRLVRRFTMVHAAEELKNLQDASENALRELDLELRMLRLYEQVFVQVRDNNQASKTINETERSLTQLAGSILTAPFEVLVTYHLLQSQLHRLAGRSDAAHLHFEKIVELFESKPLLLKEAEYQERYLNGLNNYFNSCFRLGKLDAISAIAEKIERMEPGSPRLEAAIFHNSHYVRLLYHLMNRNYQGVLPLIKPIEAGLEKYGDQIPKNRELTFRYNLGVALFFENQLIDALKWIDGLFYDTRQDMRKDIFLRARVFHLVLHFELGHDTLVVNLIPNVLRKLRRNLKPEALEIKITEALRKAIRGGPEGNKVLGNLYSTLEKEREMEEFKAWSRKYITSRLE